MIVSRVIELTCLRCLSPSARTRPYEGKRCAQSQHRNRPRTFSQKFKNGFSIARLLEFVRVCENVVYRSRVCGKKR